MGKRLLLLGLFILMMLFVGHSLSVSTLTFSRTPSEAYSKTFLSAEKFTGLCYGPYRDNESPDKGVHPTIDELSSDIALIAKLANSIRTYSVIDGLEAIPKLCQQDSIDCYPGAYISADLCVNERQIESIKKIAGQKLSRVKGMIIGNEVMQNKFVSESVLIDYIARVKQATTLPVATAATWKELLDHPQLVNSVDILFVHIYPFWDGIAVENSAVYILNKMNEMKEKYPGKKFFLGEHGWPSQGDKITGEAVPGEENQRRYISDFLAMAKSNNIEYFYFDIFDEQWKSGTEGNVGNHWGLYYSNGTVKPLLKEMIPEKAQTGIVRPPRVVQPKKANFPYIYYDGCDDKNSFAPSGLMGTDVTKLTGQIQIDEAYAVNPYSGKTCIKISYTPAFNSWAGIYWQNIVNNWGGYPGYDLSSNTSSIRKIIFHACGLKGGEKAEFKTGGINSGFTYRDSYGPLSSGIITLSKEWQEYSIDLTGADLSNVIGGFCWVSNDSQNPTGCTIYIDEIYFFGQLEPPIKVAKSHFTNGQEQNFTLTWTPSVSENDSLVTWYRIYRSQSNIFNNPYTIVIDSVAVGTKEYIDKKVPQNNVDYSYWLQAVGSHCFSIPTIAEEAKTVEENRPLEFLVSDPYPNPFNPTVTIRYQLPESTHVRLIIYDVLGRKVAILEDRLKSAGVHETVWNARSDSGMSLGSGVYLWGLDVRSHKAFGKMMLLR